jgi:hypothetical protein
MAILVACAGCGAQLRVRDEYLGRPMRCPKCGRAVETAPAVPGSNGAATTHAPALWRGAVPAARRPAAEEDYDRAPIAEPEFVPCPRCGSPSAERVPWTAWGSFWGPALFNHVRCQSCGYSYNGRTGRSNALPASVLVIIPLLLIAGILAGVFWWIFVGSRG